MNAKPLVSICCITFNHASYIGECIKGFLMQQTDFPIEILIFDDASTDGTQAFLKDSAAKDSRIRLFLQQENQWKKKKYGLLDWLFPASNGKYIALCEGDDYWTDPLKLQKQVDFLEANPLYSGASHYTQEILGNKITRVMGTQFGNVLYPENTLTRLSPFHTSSFVFKKEAIQVPDWLIKVFSGDMALFSIISKSGPIYCFQEVMSHYRVHQGGITRGKRNQYLFHKQRQYLIKCLNEFHEYKYNDIAQELIEHHKRMKYHGQNHYIGYLIWKCKDFTKKGMHRIGRITGIKASS